MSRSVPPVRQRGRITGLKQQHHTATRILARPHGGAEPRHRHTWPRARSVRRRSLGFSELKTTAIRGAVRGARCGPRRRDRERQVTRTYCMLEELDNTRTVQAVWVAQAPPCHPSAYEAGSTSTSMANVRFGQLRPGGWCVGHCNCTTYHDRLRDRYSPTSNTHHEVDSIKDVLESSSRPRERGRTRRTRRTCRLRLRRAHLPGHRDAARWRCVPASRAGPSAGPPSRRSSHLISLPQAVRSGERPSELDLVDEVGPPSAVSLIL